MEFYMDESGDMIRKPLTKEELCQFADSCQRMYFPRFDPRIDICLCSNPKFLKAAAFDHVQMMIFISKRIAPFHELSKIALLHEMVHVNLFAENGDADKEHGVRFREEICRLRELGVYDALL